MGEGPEADRRKRKKARVMCGQEERKIRAGTSLGGSCQPF